MSVFIETEKIGTNRTALPESADIVVYSFNGCENLTVGQLVNAVCCRVGMALEAQSVVKSNIITAGTDRINAYSYIISGVMDGTVNYETVLDDVAGYEGRRVRDVLEADGFILANLPASLNTINDRLTFFDLIRSDVDGWTLTSQQDLVDLQTDIARRDVAYATATNSVRTLGTTLQATASNFG